VTSSGKSVILKFLCLCTGLFFLLSPSSVPAKTLHLKFGLYAAEKPSVLVRQFRPVINEVEKNLSEILGQPVTIKIHIAKNYAKGQANLKNGTVDFSRMGPASYISAKRQSPGISVIAMESRRGKNRFFGIICVPTDSNIKNLSELKGKRFAFGNADSTIGRYLSQWLLVQNGVHAADLAEFQYLGRHDLVGTAVAAKEFDAGALKESTFYSLVKKGYKIRELARMENVTQPWIAAAHLSDKTVAALREALSKITNAGALTALKTGPFLKGTDADYNPVREAIVQNHAFFKK